MKKFLIILFTVLLFLNSVSISAGAGESFIFCYTKDNLYEISEFDVECDTGEEFMLTVSMFDFIKPDSKFCIEYNTSQVEIVNYLADLYKFDNSYIDYDEEYRTAYQWGNIIFHLVSPGKIIFSLSKKIVDYGTMFSGVVNSFKFKAKCDNVNFRFYIQNENPEPEQPPQEEAEDITAVCYTENNSVFVSGNVVDGNGDSISLMLYDDDRLCYLHQTKVKDNMFSFNIPLPDSSKNGIYTAKLTRHKNGNSISVDFERQETERKDIVVCDAVVDGNTVIFSGKAPVGALNTIALTITNLKGELCYIAQKSLNNDGSFEIRAIMNVAPSGTVYTSKLISHNSVVTSNLLFIY